MEERRGREKRGQQEMKDKRKGTEDRRSEVRRSICYH
jgi:hypothetical protein